MPDAPPIDVEEWPAPVGDTGQEQVPLWARTRARLQQWRAVGASAVVCEWIERGVPVEFEKPCPRFDHGQATMHDAALTYWRTTLAPEYIGVGAIRPIPEADAYGVSRAFLVDKVVPEGASAEFRLVVDTRFLNAHCKKHSFRFQTVDQLCKHSAPGAYFIKFDLRHAYFHLQIPPAFQKYFQFRVGGQLYQCQALPFGWCNSPFFFAKFAYPVAAFLRAGSRPQRSSVARPVETRPVFQRDRRFVLNYLDDFVCSCATFRAARCLSQLAVRLCRRLGLALKLQSCQLHPAQQVEALGLVLNSAAGTATLPDRRRKKIVQMAQALLQYANRHCRRVPKRRLAALSGAASAARLAVPYAAFHCQHLYSCLGQRQEWKPTTMVTLTHQAMRSIKWWASPPNLAGSKPLRLPAFGAKLFTDASDTGWGAHLVFRTKELQARGHWSKDVGNRHITLRELLAVRLACMSFLHVLAGQRVQLYSDASAVVAALQQFTSRSVALREELERLQEMVVLHRITLDCQHIPGQLNAVADQLSRVVDREDWRLSPSVFEHVQRRWHIKFTLDRFATALNTMCPKFNSVMWQPGTSGVDAFHQPLSSWRQEINWCNPPWSRLGDLAALLHEDRSIRGAVVAPWWPSAPWWDRLMARARAVLRLPAKEGLFASGVRGSCDYAPPPRWDVAVCML